VLVLQLQSRISCVFVIRSPASITSPSLSLSLSLFRAAGAATDCELSGLFYMT
jgi:hypothetical protein